MGNIFLRFEKKMKKSAILEVRESLSLSLLRQSDFYSSRLELGRPTTFTASLQDDFNDMDNDRV